MRKNAKDDSEYARRLGRPIAAKVVKTINDMPWRASSLMENCPDGEGIWHYVWYDMSAAIAGRHWEGAGLDVKKREVAEKTGKLTGKQRVFVREYLTDLNATRAAIRAGYGRKGAAAQASRMMAMPWVAAAIETGQQYEDERAAVTREQVIEQLRRIAFADIRELFRTDGELKRMDELDDETAAAIGSFEVEQTGDNGKPTVRAIKVRMLDKIQALYRLGQYLGAFEPKREPPQINNVIVNNVKVTIEQVELELFEIFGHVERNPPSATQLGVGRDRVVSRQTWPGGKAKRQTGKAVKLS